MPRRAAPWKNLVNPSRSFSAVLLEHPTGSLGEDLPWVELELNPNAVESLIADAAPFESIAEALACAVSRMLSGDIDPRAPKLRPGGDQLLGACYAAFRDERFLEVSLNLRRAVKRLGELPPEQRPESAALKQIEELGSERAALMDRLIENHCTEHGERFLAGLLSSAVEHQVRAEFLHAQLGWLISVIHSDYPEAFSGIFGKTTDHRTEALIHFAIERAAPRGE